MAGRLPVDASLAPSREGATERKITDALTSLSQQAYAPFSTFVEATSGTTAIGAAGTTATLIPGMATTIVVPVPSLIRVHVQVDVTVATEAAGEVFLIRLFRNAVALSTYGSATFWAAVNTRLHLPLVYMDSLLLPGTAYLYEVYANLTTGTTARYNITGARTRMLLATEAVSRVVR